MSYQLRCPSCRRLLLVRDDVVGHRLSCPLCLAEVVPPEAEAAPSAVPAPPGVRAAPQGRSPRLLPSLADRDVRADTPIIGAGLIVLAVCGVLGLVLLPVVFGGMGFALYAQLGVVLVLLTLPAWLYRVLHPRASPIQLGRGILKVLAVFGGIFLVLLAVGILLFVACFAAISSAGHH
jgi:hypothetical protein